MQALQPEYLSGCFACAMDRLGPFEPRPSLAVAVSGGADSMALALLAHDWVSSRGGAMMALTVDHGLRAASTGEASTTLGVLAKSGIAGHALTIHALSRGPALAERARDARYDALLLACRRLGMPHLLLGHHRGDQVETVMMRALSASTGRGLAGMPALLETRFVRLLRPLLDIAPERLRAFLTLRGVPWVEDPSNRDLAALRARLRLARADPAGTGEGTRAVAEAARRAGERRAERDRIVAGILAERAIIRPEGYAVLSPGPIEPDALAALLLAIGGERYAPPIDRVAALARQPGPATMGGVRLVPAGRLGPGWLLIRERRAMRAPVAARPDAVWDGRFRLVGGPPDGFASDLVSGAPESGAPAPGALVLGALAADASRFRNRSGPPALILQGLPALRSGSNLIAVPHIGFGDPRWRVVFDPRNRAAGAPFRVGLSCSSG